MINITTSPDIRLYINNNTNWITVAKGFNRTISYISDLSNQCPNPNYNPVQWLDPPTNTIPNPLYDPIQFFTGIVTQPSNLVINGSGDINATTYTATASRSCDGVTDSEIYNYEVISPKIVYQRIDNSTRVMFIDVTRLSTYNHLHNIVVNNTAWMQNPDLIRGRILIQKADVNGVFAPANVDNVFPDIIGSMSLGSQVVLDNLPETPCLYRAIYEIRLIPNCGGTSPLVFQAIGDAFEFKSYFYTIPSPYSTVVGEDNKYLHWLDTLTNTDYVTSEIDRVFTVNVNSANIDYKYKYVTSSASNLPVPNVSYFVGDKKIEGFFDDITPLFNSIVTFNGTEKQFINGQLIDTVIAFTETKSIWLEGVRPTALFEQVDCSYNELLTDTTVVDNPHWIMRGVVKYEIYNEDTEQWEKLIDLTKLATYIIKNCSIGEYRIRNKFVLRAIPNCGGTSPIIFETEWYEYLYNVLEYKPFLSIPTSECCHTINKAISAIPLSLILNNNSCPTIPINPNQIKYELYKYNRTTRLYEIVNTTTIPVVTPIVLANYEYVFTPVELTNYKLVATLYNCCTAIVKEEYYNICEAVRITNNDCNIYKLENTSLVDTYNIEIKNVITNVVINTTLKPNETKQYTLSDGIYTIGFGTTSVLKYKVVYVYCTIESCYMKSIRDLLCRMRDCKECKSIEDVKRLAELSEFRALYQAWMKAIEVDYRLEISYTIVDITNKLNEFKDNNLLYKYLLQYCEPCNKQIENCGC